MASLVAAAPPRADRLARRAVGVLFFTNGALFANLIPRYPQIKADLGLSNAMYGVSVAAFPAGAIVAGLGASVLIRRFGSGRVAVAGTWLAALALLIAAILPSAIGFAAALFVAGAMDAITDVAQNAHGLRVQRRYGRSIINSFHAVWSIGAVTGGAMAAGAIALHLPRGIHLAISAVVLSLLALVALRYCLPGTDDEQVGDDDVRARTSSPRRRVHVGPATIALVGALVLIAMAGSVVEDAGNSWATLYLSNSLGAAAATASFGFIAVVGAQFVGRLLGDRLVDRFGQRAVARAGGALVAVGMGSALAFPTIPGTMLGFAAAGFGIATLVPAAMHEADEIPGLRPGTGLTVVSWLMRLGFLFSPPVVGAIADATSLRAGLLVVPAAGLAVVMLAGVLTGRRTSHRDVSASSG